MPSFGCKSWNESKAQIERTVISQHTTSIDNEIGIKSGLQLRTSISHYPSPIFSSCYHDDPSNTKEYFVTNYMSMDGGGSMITEWEYDAENNSSVARRKFRIRNCLKHLVWISSQRTFVGYCDDMTLRGYKGSNFEEKVRVCVANTCLCAMYLEDFDELITAGQSHVTAWRLHQIEFGRPFEWKDPAISCDVTDEQDVWVSHLWYSKRTKTLLALSEQRVYMIDMKIRRQVSKMENSHSASLCSCAWFPRFSYLITAARDGSIHVYHTVTNAMVHKFPAHRDGRTGVDCTPNQPILLSWSHASGCVRVWRLDTLEMMDESTLSERISKLHLVSSNRLFYQSDSSIRVFDLNVLFTIFTTLSAPAQSLKLFWIDNCDESQRRRIESIKYSSTQVGCEVNGETGSCESLTRDGEQTREIVFTSRLLCILEDGCVVTVSPVTGSVIHIIYPPTSKDRDKHPLDIAVTFDGDFSFITPRSGDVMKFNCVVNPGEEADTRHFFSDVTCIGVMFSPRYNLDEDKTHSKSSDAERKEEYVTAVLLGCDTGFLRIVLKSSFVLLKNGRTKPLVMDPIKIHAGAVSFIFSSAENQAFSSYVEEVDPALLSFRDVVITAGTDLVVNIWRMKIRKASFREAYVMLPSFLGKINPIRMPRKIVGTGGALMMSHDDGILSLHKICFDTTTNTGGAKVSSVTSHAIDHELRHRSEISSLAASEILCIFLTCGRCELVKIWDLEGQLLRELDIGPDCYSACFVNGRDLVAAYRNHVILIDAHDYLPMEQLEELLEFDEAFLIKDVEAESPIPMKGGADIGAYAVRPIHHTFEHSKTRRTADDAGTEYQRKREKSICARRKFFALGRKARKPAVDAEVASKIAKIEAKRLEEITDNRSSTAHPIRGFDPAVLKEATIHRMKLWPIAPDGYIPNSVIRKLVSPVFNSLLGNAIAVPDELHRCKSKDYSTNRCQQADAKFLSPSTGLDDMDEARIVVKKRGRFRQMKNNKSRANHPLTALEEVLRCISKESWCPTEIDPSNVEEGLIRMSRDLEHSNGRVILKILASILKIHEKCKAQKDKSPPSSGPYWYSGISVACQEALARRLFKLLHHNQSEIREMAACVLSKFHHSILEVLKVEFLQPLLRHAVKISMLKDLVKDKHFINVATATSAIAGCIGPEALMNVSELKKEQICEETIEDLGSILTVSVVNKGVPRPAAKAWSSFILKGFRLPENYVKNAEDGGKAEVDSCLSPGAKTPSSHDESSDLTSTSIFPESTYGETSATIFSGKPGSLTSSVDPHFVISSGHADEKSLLDVGDMSSLHSHTKSKMDPAKIKLKERGEIGAVHLPKKDVRGISKLSRSLCWIARRPIAYKSETICVWRCSEKIRPHKLAAESFTQTTLSFSGTTSTNEDKNVARNEFSLYPNVQLGEGRTSHWRSILHDLRKIRITHESLGEEAWARAEEDKRSLTP